MIGSLLPDGSGVVSASMLAVLPDDDSPSVMSSKPHESPLRRPRAAPERKAQARVSRPAARAPARRHPGQARSRQTVDAIVEAAGRLLVENGRAAVTTNAVAVRAGVSIGSVYQYFRDKDSIFTALQDRHRDQVMPLVHHALARLGDPAVDMVEAILALVRALLELHADDPGRMRALTEQLDEQLSPADLEAFTDTTAGMLAARTGGRADALRPVAWLACLTVTHVGRSLVHQPPALDLDDLFAALARMLRALFAQLGDCEG